MSKKEAPKKLIFSCSGGSDVGELADRTARQLTRDGVGKIFCLASMAAGIEKKVQMAKDADMVFVINACPLDCASKTLAAAGIDWTASVRLTDEGFEKGATPSTPENIGRAVEVCKAVVAE